MKYTKLWKKHQFKIIVTCSFVFMVILYFIQDNTPGTWSLEYSYKPTSSKTKYVKESKGELECRRVMEKIFKKPFPCKRPSFLLNTVTGKPLEIDCCNIELQLGVEYNGKQHYQYTPGMHKNQETFQLQKYRDEMKMKRCRDIGFNLIVVPYTIGLGSIENYILEELKKLGYKGI